MQGEVPATRPDPDREIITCLSAGFAKDGAAAVGEVGSPERFQRLPLLALVKDIGTKDQIELLPELCGLPVELPGARGSLVREAVQFGEEECRGFQVREENGQAEAGGDHAGEAHAATQVQNATGGWGDRVRG